MIGSDGKLHSTGALLGTSLNPAGADGILGTLDDQKVTMATWGDLKANAATFLGIKISDADVNSVPLLATDPYGNFIPGAHGLPQLVVKWTSGPLSGQQGLIEGNLATPIATTGTFGNAATRRSAVGTAFINDMAQTANPFDANGILLKPDADAVAGNAIAIDPTGNNVAYDNELLDKHYVAGDGRVNENIGLTAIQELFHSEHDRLLAQIKGPCRAISTHGDTSFATNWVLPGVVLTPARRSIAG